VPARALSNGDVVLIIRFRHKRRAGATSAEDAPLSASRYFVGQSRRERQRIVFFHDETVAMALEQGHAGVLLSMRHQ
jgi:hypothetical protein